MAEKKQALLTIRPQFSSFLAILESLVAASVGTVFFTLIGGTLLLAFIAAVGIDQWISGSTIYALLFIFGLIVFPPSYYDLKRKVYQRTLYNFYKDYMEFQNFKYLINRRVGRISYRDITNVSERANVVQQREKITSIYLFVPSIAMGGDGRFAGLKITDISQSEGSIEKILELIDQSRQPAADSPAPGVAVG